MVPDDIGDKKLGILKMDVDNLGAVFAFGLKEEKTDSTAISSLQRSLSKYLTLSRLMELFFGKTLKDICKEKSQDTNPEISRCTINEDMFYINYAGGDDLVIIGPAYGIMFLAESIELSFNDFVLNKNITISGGIFIQNDKEPIRFGIQKADEMLEKSKAMDGKNHITILDVSLPFDRYSLFLNAVLRYQKYITGNVISRTNLYGIMSMLRDKNYPAYLSSIPLIQYSLYRNIKKENKDIRTKILKDLMDISNNKQLNQYVLLLKTAIMFTRD